MRMAYNPAKAKAEREWYKAHGICPTCRHRDAAIGFVQCPECIERESAYQAKRREADRDGYNAKRREERQRAKARGICPRCQHYAAAPGRIMCENCLQANRMKSRSRYIREVKPDGVCKWCDAPVVDGKKFCMAHYDTMRQVGLNMREHVRDNWFIKTSKVVFGIRNQEPGVRERR